MIRNNDQICVGVSGGKDSLALLHVMKKISEKHTFKIIPVMIDEGIPGYRNEALKIVEDFCSKLKIDLRIFSYQELFNLTLDEALNLRENDKISSCSICGILRRRALDHAANEVGANVIATGHNLDDVLQTFFINILSGDTNKIGWMDLNTSSNPIRKIKPFSEIYESEIVFYAFTNQLPFQAESCPHMAEGIRTEIREFLNSLENKHFGIKNNIFNSMKKISQITKDANCKQSRICPNCGYNCTSKICSVCNILTYLKKEQC